MCNSSDAIKEKKYRLKYLYFLNIEKIMEDVKNSEACKKFKKEDPSSITSLFQSIFAKIIDVSSPYSEYILSNHTVAFNSIFGEDSYSEKPLYLHTLSGISLFHHCIVRGYLDKLSATPKYTECTRLSTTNFPSICKSITQLSEEPKQKADPCDSAKDCNRNKRLKENEESYSTELLEKYRTTTESSTSERTTYEVPKYASLFCYFLWEERSVRTFSKSLLSPPKTPATLLKNYKNLKEDFESYRQKVSESLDFFVLNIFIEASYGFSIISYTESLLAETEKAKTATDSTDNLKGIDGSGLVNLLKNVLNLPLIFNRSIFMEYALQAIRASENLASQFPPSSGNAGAIYLSNALLSRVQLGSKVYQLMDSYFRMLNFITIPLIEDLWDVLTVEFKIDLESYETYIKNHYDFITYDYSLINLSDLYKKDEEKRKYQTPGKSLDFFHYYRTWENKLNEIEKGSHELNRKHLPITVKRDLANLIQYYCNAKRADIFNTQLMDMLLDNFQKDNSSKDDSPKPSSPRSSCDIEKRIFLENHIHALYDFANSLPLDSLPITPSDKSGIFNH